MNNLIRSNKGIIAGVCAGIAEFLGWDISLTRLVFLLIGFITGILPFIIAYAVLWIMMPPPPPPEGNRFF